MPVSGDGLVPFRGFRSALRDVIRPADGEVAAEQEDLFLVVAQPGAEGVAGVVPAAVPVPQPVVDDPGGDGGVVAFAQAVECLLVQGGVPAGAGGLDGPVGVAQDRDDVAGPVLDAAGAEFRDRAAPPDDVGSALLDARQPGKKMLVAGVAVGDQVPGERCRQPGRVARTCRAISMSSRALIARDRTRGTFRATGGFRSTGCPGHGDPKWPP